MRAWDYTDIYVAACLRPFNTHAEGRAHERDCPQCQAIIRGEPEESEMEPIHLGDGAYVSEGSYAGEVVVTSGHHDPNHADDVVCLDPAAVPKLIAWLQEHVKRLRDENPT